MKEVATILFHDNNTSSEAIAIIRYNANQVSLSISLRLNGDIEVIMNKQDAKKILNALNIALHNS